MEGRRESDPHTLWFCKPKGVPNARKKKNLRKKDSGKGILKICSKFTGENICRNMIFRYGCFLVNLLRIFRTPFTRNKSGRLFLKIF